MAVRLEEHLKRKHRTMKEHVLRHTGGMIPRMYPIHILYLCVATEPDELTEEIKALREIWDVEWKNDNYLSIYVELYERERIRYDPYASLIGAPAFY